MIVWGGTDSLGNTTTGASYNPTTNTWTAVTTADAPSGRSGHTALWTGTEMTIWGGDPSINSGANYRATTNTWRPTTTTGAPAGRSGHSSVWTGNQMVIWGGESGALTNTGGRYTP